ncbi:hypothetical protein [Sporosarcina sp. G11-34]|uniref:hypothetical protein n=1 Tax=Sporosarcina sp. G11-34 TaxID=2849605 RepID=UPI0022A90BB8|nr:hypothetical protein [Sporosarcina sp. G11-34]MCZ2258602.1 hypothetical protein [Sporosarcina sp. G11-34]
MDFLKKYIYLLGIATFIIVLLVACEKKDNPEDVKTETMSKVNEEIADSSIKNYIKGGIELIKVESHKVESLLFYDFYLEAELSNEFNSLTDEEKYTLLKELDYIKLDGMFIGENSYCNVETFTLISDSDKYRVEPSLGFSIYKNDKDFSPKSKVPYVPSGGIPHNPADNNSKGEYKPVEDMNQEEIEAELEEILGDFLGQ